MSIDHQGYIYILTNATNRVLYIGVTTNLVKRISEHKGGLIAGFTQNYNIHKLVYYEVLQDISIAIRREKQLKAGSRENKLRLIEAMNPCYEDLYPQLI